MCSGENHIKLRFFKERVRAYPLFLKGLIEILVLLATGSDKIDKYIKEVSDVQFDTVSSRRYIIEKNIESHYHLIFLSAALPGRESMREIIFETQRESGCRIVYLVGSTKPHEIIDMFLLGVRDFIFEPIDPKLLLSSITEPATYGNAANKLKNLPVSSESLINKVWELIRKNTPDPPPEVTSEAKELIKGLLKLLHQEEGNSLEESLVNIEEGLSQLITQKL